MIGTRTRYSLAQYLELQDSDYAVMLTNKHNIRCSWNSWSGEILITALTNSFCTESDEKILAILEEIARTERTLRTRVEPRYIHDERFDDLKRCLQLDGYIIENKVLLQIDPSFSDAIPLDDDLLSELNASDLNDAEEIVTRINSSSDQFRSATPNYNACLNDIRIALETLAKAIAVTRQSECPSPYNRDKWGEVIKFLQTTNFISDKEEKGLAGVYSFVSDGCHRSIGLTEEQMARLGRSLALGMCWFLIKNYKENNRDSIPF